MKAYPVGLVLIGCGLSGAINFNVTTFQCPFTTKGAVTTEALRFYTPIERIHTSTLTVNILSNTLNVACTVRSRVDATDGNQLVSIPAASVVTIQDLANTDTIAPLGTFGWEFDTTASASGAISLIGVNGVSHD